MRRSRTGMARAVAVLASVALVAAACGGSDDTPAAPAPAPAPEAPAAPAEPESLIDPEFYAGKTITILVPAAPGGGADNTAQFHAPLLQQFIPGNPTIRIEHDTAGGGIAAGNRYFNQMDPDGYTIFLSAFTTTIPWLVGESLVQYDVSQLTQLAAFPFSGMIMARADTGITSVMDLPGKASTLVKGGVSPISTDIMGVLALEVLGVRGDIKEIWGYGGTGDHIKAFEAGETNLDATTNSVWNSRGVPLREAGIAVPIVAYGFLQADGTFARDVLLPDIPTVDEAHQMLYGTPPSGPAWEAFKAVMSVIHVAHGMTMHPDAPPQAAATIREGIRIMVEETNYVNDWLARNPRAPFYTPAELDGAQAAVAAVDAAFGTYMSSFLSANYPNEIG
jgi:tripartite-type tricarboxylate transporter receptor subunit TctC